ncbi:hypothetical protein Tco_0487450 [Tanacetum coccineum]
MSTKSSHVMECPFLLFPIKMDALLLFFGKIFQKSDVSLCIVAKQPENIETIRERLKVAQDRWKSYADYSRRPIEFNVGDFVMLKVSPWKEMRVNLLGRISDNSRKEIETTSQQSDSVGESTMEAHKRHKHLLELKDDKALGLSSHLF